MYFFAQSSNHPAVPAPSHPHPPKIIYLATFHLLLILRHHVTYVGHVIISPCASLYHFAFIIIPHFCLIWFSQVPQSLWGKWSYHLLYPIFWVSVGWLITLILDDTSERCKFSLNVTVIDNASRGGGGGGYRQSLICEVVLLLIFDTNHAQLHYSKIHIPRILSRIRTKP